MRGRTTTLFSPRQTAILALSLALALLAPAAEARRKKGKQDKPKGAEVLKEGKIRVVRGLGGGEPQLTDQHGTKHLCIGPARDELLRLNGHRLKAWGVVGDKKKLMMPTFKVSRYEITDSGGRKPVVGILRKEPKDRYVLERKEGNLTIKARASFKRQLRRRVGCKIWIVGDLEGTTLKAFKFGWINCKAPKAIKPRKETTK
jgi:hypothetical protein